MACVATLYACGSTSSSPSGSSTGNTSANGTTASGNGATGSGGAQAGSGTQTAVTGTTASTASGPGVGTTSTGPATASVASSGTGPASSSASGGGCLKCAAFAMMANANPNQLCANSKPLFDNFKNCVCVTKCMAQCGQACQAMGMFPQACQVCAGMNCMAEIQACQADK